MYEITNEELQACLPIVVAVMDAKRPNMQEKGRESAIAPDPIFPTCPCDHNRLFLWPMLKHIEVA